MAKIGLVTVLFNCDEVLPDFFRSLSFQSFTNYILYLVDNSANEKTDTLIADCIARFPVPAFKYINSGSNIGVAAGNNTGIQAALADDCSHILFLNNDIELEQDNVLGKLLETSNIKRQDLVVPKIFYYDSRKLWMAGGYMDKWRALGVHHGYNKPDGLSYNQGKSITYAPTCFMLVSAEVFAKTGVMDEKYFAYYDDTDFVYRALQDGFIMYYEPSVYVLHKVSSSTGGDTGFYVYYSSRNKVYFIRKHLKGLHKYFAIAYMLVSRIAFWLKYDTERRKKLILGIKNGFKVPL
jgi:hypothetical protein